MENINAAKLVANHGLIRPKTLKSKHLQRNLSVQNQRYSRLLNLSKSHKRIFSMMSEHKTLIKRSITVDVGWTDVFSCATELLEKTLPSDVRWVHVERARAIYDGIKTLFDAKTTSPDTSVSTCSARHICGNHEHRCCLPSGHTGRHQCGVMQADNDYDGDNPNDRTQCQVSWTNNE
jgi:hypothetical protein